MVGYHFTELVGFNKDCIKRKATSTVLRLTEALESRTKRVFQNMTETLPGYRCFYYGLKQFLIIIIIVNN